MTWHALAGLFLMLNPLFVIPIAYLVFLRPHHRNYKIGQIAWFKQLGAKWHWTLVQIVKNTEYPTVYHVRTLDDNQRHIVGRYELRPIRWWQHNKVDPIVMKYFLLGEFE